MRVPLVHAQIIEGRQGGTFGPEIGDALNRDADTKLPIEGENNEVDPAKVRLNKLVRACGRLDRSSRPQIDAILMEAKSIYDSPGVLEVGNLFVLYDYLTFCHQGRTEQQQLEASMSAHQH